MAKGSYGSAAPKDAVPLLNSFDFLFSQPFQSENTFTPPSQVVPRIKDDRPIFVDNATDRALTYGQIRTDALALASGLLSLGLDPSDVRKLPPTATCPQGAEVAPIVLIQLPNGLAITPILLGTFAAGLTATMVSPSLTSDEISWIVQNARPRAIITAKACLGNMRAALAKQADQAYFGSVPLFTVDAGLYPSHNPSTTTPPTTDWTALLTTAHPPPHPTPFPPSSAAVRTAVILWSSGTSGRSKGVLLSHHAVNFSNASTWHDADNYQSIRQTWLGYVPFYHVFGLMNIMLLALTAGATVYTMAVFNLDAMLASIPKRGVTYLHMAPPIAVMLAKAPSVAPYAARDPSTGHNAFRTVVGAVTGGAPLGHEVVVQVYERCGFRIRLGYGLSETSCTTLQRGFSRESMARHAGDTGTPHFGVELMIADPSGASTQPVPAGQEGEVLVRGPPIMLAYLPVGFFTAVVPGGPELDMSTTSEALTADGWFRTGDVGALSADGSLRITDRLKELIKVRAFQVAPAELEAFLCSSAKVADAGVVGVYDDDEATEWPRAYVVAAGGKGQSEEVLTGLAQELKGLIEKSLTRYKWLKGGVVFVDQIPKSPSGKILRRVLKQGNAGGFGVELYPKRRVAAKL
ncbi:acetyl-CoA synthetase-like protein [Podospora appendiculata]|uniref:Acetyl-CoA synthetase-like protein n=1 Tax=Podospora appendiculata TaxID=314037 RepID=A0AAE1CIE0_9PEZI|nr:acetyl-CoA synthetase-like protein [Podospora appendiculata]